jgi:hypothetical protein
MKYLHVWNDWLLLCTNSLNLAVLQICTAFHFPTTCLLAFIFKKYSLFFGNVVGIKINANGNLAWGTENIWTCVFYLLLYLSILLFFSSFYSFSLILSQKKFSVRTQSSLPQSSLHSSHTEVCRQLWKKQLGKNSFPASFFVMATWQLILFRVQEGVPRRGGLGPRHSMRLRPPPLPLQYWCRFVRA